jgi:hypothetical protein
MPLGTNLATDLQAVWDSNPPTVHDAAVGAAQAYYTYASGALFGLSVPINLTTAQRDALAATLEAALTPMVMATAAAAWAAGLTAFWTGVACAGASGAGPVIPPPGAAGVPAGLIAIAVTFPPTTAIGAAGFAAVIDAATRTTQATLTLPPNPPANFPIS